LNCFEDPKLLSYSLDESPCWDALQTPQFFTRRPTRHRYWLLPALGLVVVSLSSYLVLISSLEDTPVRSPSSFTTALFEDFSLRSSSIIFPFLIQPMHFSRSETRFLQYKSNSNCRQRLLLFSELLHEYYPTRRTPVPRDEPPHIPASRPPVCASNCVRRNHPGPPPHLARERARHLLVNVSPIHHSLAFIKWKVPQPR